MEGNNEALKDKLTDCEGQIGQLIKEAKDMLVVHDELRRKLEENGKVCELCCINVNLMF